MARNQLYNRLHLQELFSRIPQGTRGIEKLQQIMTKSTLSYPKRLEALKETEFSHAAPVAKALQDYFLNPTHENKQKFETILRPVTLNAALQESGLVVKKSGV
jgi:hypothetical protein